MKYYDELKQILESNLASRDCDEILTEEFYKTISPNLITMSWIAVSLRVRRKTIPPSSTIKRVGRKIKEENEHLRGDNYVERKTVKVEYVQGLMKL